MFHTLLKLSANNRKFVANFRFLYLNENRPVDWTAMVYSKTRRFLNS